MPSLPLRLLCLLLLATGPAAAWADARTEAVELARTGRTGEALRQLEALYGRDPAPVVLHDLVTVAEWHGDHERVRALAQALEPSATPPWAAAAAGRAFERAGEQLRAARWFAVCAAATPSTPDCAIAAARNRAEAGDPARALRSLQSLEAEHAGDARIPAARARVLQAQGRWGEAAAAWREAADRQPHEHAFARAAFEAHLAGGDIDAAERTVESAAPQLPAVEELALRVDLATAAIRRIEPPPHADPAAATRAARVIRLLQRNIDMAEPGSAAWRRSRFDLVEALHRADRPRAAVAEWETLRRDGLQPPAYVHDAACSALERLVAAGQGDEAERLARCLRTLAEREPPAIETRRRLFHAHLAADRHAAALRTIDALAEERPSGPDPRTAAVARAWLDDLPDAEQRLERLRATDADDAALTSDLATVQRWRGWPRRARATYAEVPDGSDAAPGARAGAAHALMDVAEYEEADEVLNALVNSQPGAPGLGPARHRHGRATGWGLSHEVRVGRSDGANFGSRELQATVRLESPLITEHGRWYARGDYAWARFPEGNGNDRRAALGWHHRERAWGGFAEVHAGSAVPGAEAAIGIEFNPDDHWALAASVDSDSPQAPLRGRRRGITARSLDLVAAYRWHERRSARIGAGAMDFDDGNERRSVYAAITQRLYTHPRGRLDGEASIYRSTNTLDGAAYFNPSSDLSLVVGVTADWRNRRWMSDRLRQRLGLHVGRYRQDGFDAGAIGGLRYAHRWTLPSGNGLRYGVEVNERIYDGAGETQYYAFFGFDWRWASP